MAASPVFAVTPRIGAVQLSVANTNRDGTTGTYGTLISAGNSGTRIAEIAVQATGTTTAGMVRLFTNDGTNNRMFDEISVAAASPTASVKATRISTTYTNLTLPSGWSIKASTHNGEVINVFALGADL
jgi:hypothetical protein